MLWLPPVSTLVTGFLPFPVLSFESLFTLIMAEELEQYLAVLKASYDYEPQSEEEIAIKEDQLLFLLERTDEE